MHLFAILPQDFTYLVADEQLEKASCIVSDFGLPHSEPPHILAATSGDLYTEGHLHRLTKSTLMSTVQFLHLFPASFASFTPSELYPAPDDTSLPLPILIPRAPALYSCLIRIMSRYPRNSRARSTLAAQLAMYINYHLLGSRLEDGHEDTEDEDCERPKDYGHIADAISLVRGWICGSEWRAGDEWMGDALVAIISGEGETRFLPWRARNESENAQVLKRKRYDKCDEQNLTASRSHLPSNRSTASSTLPTFSSAALCKSLPDEPIHLGRGGTVESVCLEYGESEGGDQAATRPRSATIAQMDGHRRPREGATREPRQIAYFDKQHPHEDNLATTVSRPRACQKRL